VQYRGLSMKFNLLFVLFTFPAHRFLPKYDVRMQLLMFQIKMLRDRTSRHRRGDRCPDPAHGDREDQEQAQHL